MKYRDVVKKAQEARKTPYSGGSIEYKPCETWLRGDQINLWTYWHGYQMKDIDTKGVDILLVGQDWGNPWKENNEKVCKIIEEIQDGSETATYNEKLSVTDQTMTEMFKAFGKNIDITKKDPGIRLFFTNYSLGYRAGRETGGMTKALMRKDEEFFNDLVLAIKPKVIICLGQLTYEVVSGTTTKDFSKQLMTGKPFKAAFPLKTEIPVYGVAHYGSRGRQNVGGLENMRKAWDRIAQEYTMRGNERWK